MSDNVIILGAGASRCAGIPLMKDFVPTMWEFAKRGEAHGMPLTTEDQKLLKAAMAIRTELDMYHGRAMFDDRNLEDILSLLSFADMADPSQDHHRLSTFTRAISRTIELTCKVVPEVTEQGVTPYYSFWLTLFGRIKANKSLPTIITFNYDLVLERSLCRALDGDWFTDYEKEPSFGSVSIKYYHDTLQQVDLVPRTSDSIEERPPQMRAWMRNMPSCGQVADIEILKLHGSLNFPTPGTTQASSPVQAADAPLILPPIFDKMSYGESLRNTWAKALQQLQHTKNIFIVGYSLPSTDIYMQYFLKAGLGPNTDLNHVFVYDPVLFEPGDDCNAMIERYRTCFSSQVQRNIEFTPPYSKPSGTSSRPRTKPGTLQHFVEGMRNLFF